MGFWTANGARALGAGDTDRFVRWGVFGTFGLAAGARSSAAVACKFAAAVAVRDAWVLDHLKAPNAEALPKYRLHTC